MKVVHVVGFFYPDTVGGAELYGIHLANALRSQGVDVVLAVPGSQTAFYDDRGLSVYRYEVPSASRDFLGEFYGQMNVEAGRQFAKILDKEKPDIIHLHAFSRSVPLDLLCEVKKRNILVVFTYHTPSISCPQGTLLRWDKEICDGVLRNPTCTQCVLHHYGLPKPLAKIFGRLPEKMAQIVGKFIKRKNKIVMGMRMSELIGLKKNTFHQLMEKVDVVLIHAYWVKELLIKNHVCEKKIIFLSQATDLACAAPSEYGKCDMQEQNRVLRLVCFGRMHPTKGMETLMKVLRSSAELKVTLDLYGIAVFEKEKDYEKKLRHIARNDPRIRFKYPVPHEQIVSVLKSYDALVVPSQWLETGPLVILEAFAAGIPVIGSDLGGIAEKITHGHDGLLVRPFDSTKAWSETIARIAKDEALLKKLKLNIQPPKTMEFLAREMVNLYKSLLT